jgi:hypothetical protein
VAAEGRVRAEDVILSGPRGVGKTVTMTAFGDSAREQGFEVVNLQAVSGQAGLVDSLMEWANTRLAHGDGPWQRARAALERIGGLNFSFAGIGAGVTVGQRGSAGAGEPVRADAGTVAEALSTLAAEVRKDRPQGGVVVTVDEMQAAAGPDLALLAAALHRLNVDHPAAAVMFAGTGLPHIPQVLDDAGVTHPDRLFALEPLSLTLAHDDALYAIVEPARQVGVLWEPAAAERVVAVTNGYPAHLQLFADVVWAQAPGPDAIRSTDVEAALPAASDLLERRTLTPRWDRFTPRQREFVAALAVLGGEAAMPALGHVLDRPAKDLSWLRDELIKSGDIYAPAWGMLRLTVPTFAQYVLAHYDETVPRTTTPVASLATIRARMKAASGDK